MSIFALSCLPSPLRGQEQKPLSQKELVAQLLFQEGVQNMMRSRYSVAYHQLATSFRLAPTAEAASRLGELTTGRSSELSLSWRKKAFELAPDELLSAWSYAAHYFNTQEWDEAIAILTRYRSYKPDDIDAALPLVECYIAAKRWDEAQKLITDIRPRILGTENEQQLQQIQLKLIKAMGGNQEQMRLYAEEVLKSNIKENPQEAIVGLLILLSEGDPEGAQNIIERLPSEERGLFFIRLTAAATYIKRKQTELAITELKRLIAMEEAPLQLSAIVSVLKEAAIGYIVPSVYNPIFELLLQQHPDNFDLSATFVSQLYGQGKAKEAEQLLLRMTQQFPKEHPELWATLIEARLMEDDNRGAEELIAQGLKQYPNHSVFTNYLALIRFAENDIREAERLFHQSLENIAPEDRIQRAEVLSHLGDLYYRENNLPKTFEYYEKSLTEHPKLVSTLNNYAYYLANSGGDIEKCARMAAEAAQIEPENPHILDTYGYILTLQGNYTLAEIYLRKALELTTDIKERQSYLIHYTEVLIHLKRYEEALQLLQEHQRQVPESDLQKMIELLQSLIKK